VAHPVTILTHTEGQPTSTSFPLSPTEVDHPVRSIAEYMLAREKMIWKKEYEYVTGLALSFSSFSSVLLSNGSRGFPAPSSETRKLNREHQFLWPMDTEMLVGSNFYFPLSTLYIKIRFPRTGD
jgi:hypothetical protein